MDLIQKSYDQLQIEYRIITGRQAVEIKPRPGVVKFKDESGRLVAKVFNSALLPVKN